MSIPQIRMIERGESHVRRKRVPTAVPHGAQPCVGVPGGIESAGERGKVGIAPEETAEFISTYGSFRCDYPHPGRFEMSMPSGKADRKRADDVPGVYQWTDKGGTLQARKTEIKLDGCRLRRSGHRTASQDDR